MSMACIFGVEIRRMSWDTRHVLTGDGQNVTMVPSRVGLFPLKPRPWTYHSKPKVWSATRSHPMLWRLDSTRQYSYENSDRLSLQIRHHSRTLDLQTSSLALSTRQSNFDISNSFLIVKFASNKAKPHNFDDLLQFTSSTPVILW